jgi:hypothetical protein
MEFASHGTLADRLKALCGAPAPEAQVLPRCHTAQAHARKSGANQV